MPVARPHSRFPVIPLATRFGAAAPKGIRGEWVLVSKPALYLASAPIPEFRMESVRGRCHPSADAAGGGDAQELPMVPGKAAASDLDPLALRVFAAG